MSERKTDLIDLQMEFGDAFAEAGMTREDLDRQVRKLRVLRFALDVKKTNVVSRLDGKIVFVDRFYDGTVAVGDVWLCLVEDAPTVYYAVPLKKISAATVMELDDRLREDIVAHMWEINKRTYVRIFEEKYREDLYAKATDEANAKNSEVIRNLREQVSELEKQVEQSKIVIESRLVPSAEDEIELSSDDVPSVAACAAVPIAPLVPDGPSASTSPPIAPPRPCNRVPGIPEIRRSDAIPGAEPVSQKYDVERLDENTLYSDSFADGKYFVHINLSGKFLVIRPNGYANVIATNRRIAIAGLGAMSKFTERGRLIAEYSARYNGLLVYL